jgi:hypothetical protein
MVDLTLFEMHLEDTSFVANAPSSGSDDARTSGDTGGPRKLLLGAIEPGLAGVLVWWFGRNTAPDTEDTTETTG